MCIRDSADYGTKLVLATSVPLAVSAATLLFEKILAMYGEGGYTLRSMGVKVLIMLMFFILPTTSSVIMYSFVTKVSRTLIFAYTST